jgi:hypothetical protein
MTEEYLVEAIEKEREAIRRLPELLITLGVMFHAVGVNPRFAWYLLEVDMSRLSSELKGDVDILAGSLGWNSVEAFWAKVAEQKARWPDADPTLYEEWAAIELAEAGEIKWPPDTEYLIGVEAKCSYRSKNGRLKSTKSSDRKVEKLREEISKLQDLGVNRVLLLDWIANPPASSEMNGQAWLIAGNEAHHSVELMLPICARRLPAECMAGQWVHSIGAVAGGDEREQGAGLPIRLREAQLLCADDDSIQLHRRELDKNLRIILEGFPRPAGPGPFGLSLFFIDCRSCGKIHLLRNRCR